MTIAILGMGAAVMVYIVCRAVDRAATDQVLSSVCHAFIWITVIASGIAAITLIVVIPVLAGIPAEIVVLLVVSALAIIVTAAKMRGK